VKLDRHDHVEISDLKVRDYLLSREHPIGRFKADFLSRLGFTSERCELLTEAIRGQLAPLDVEPGRVSTYGTKYLTKGVLRGPSGNQESVVVVWIPNPPPASRFDIRYGHLRFVGFTDLMLNVLQVRLRSNRLAFLRKVPVSNVSDTDLTVDLGGLSGLEKPVAVW